MDITGPKRFIWQYSNRVKHYMKYLFLVHDEDNDNLIQVLQALSDVTGSGSQCTRKYAFPYIQQALSLGIKQLEEILFC